jgi:hypothetical protein
LTPVRAFFPVGQQENVPGIGKDLT